MIVSPNAFTVGQNPPHPLVYSPERPPVRPGQNQGEEVAEEGEAEAKENAVAGEGNGEDSRDFQVGGVIWNKKRFILWEMHLFYFDYLGAPAGGRPLCQSGLPGRRAATERRRTKCPASKKWVVL